MMEYKKQTTTRLKIPTETYLVRIPYSVVSINMDPEVYLDTYVLRTYI